MELTTVNRDVLYLIEDETDYIILKRQTILLYVRSGRAGTMARHLAIEDLEPVAPGTYRGTRTR